MTRVEDESSREDEDATARRSACSQFDAPLVLEAGAGTGKTTALVARLVTWCLGPGWERACASRVNGLTDARIARDVLDGLVAITFTEKAAAEMGARLARALAGLAAGEVQRGLFADLLPADADVLRARARALAAALDRPVVHTIHAFCKGLLAAHPLEAGLAPYTTVDVDGRALRAIAREVVDEHVARLATRAPDDDERALFGLSIGAARVEAALVQLAQDGARPEDFGGDPCSPAAVAQMQAELARRAQTFLAHAQPLASAPASSVRGARELLEVVRHTAGAFAPWPPNVRKRLHAWAKADFTAAEERALGPAAREVECAALELASIEGELHELDLRTVGAAHRVLQPLFAELRRRFVARGLASYGDLLRDARDLLRDHDNIAAAERRHTTQVCIDEFQDTDGLQCDLVWYLALQPMPGARQPGLFLVGDPKQSIYGWRNADLAAYQDFVQKVLARGGTLARLSVNYRSTRAVLAGVEQAIAPVMRAQPGLQPAYEPLVAARADDGPPIERWLSWNLDESTRAFAQTSADTAYAIEADWIARDVAQAARAGADIGQSALLLRTMGPIETYLAALRHAGVPYEVSGEKSYYRRREILDAAALVRAVVDPDDALACMTYLRSSAALVPDAVWLPLSAEKFFALAAEMEDERGLPEVLAAVERALAHMPRDVPGLERIGGFGASLVAAVQTLAALRRSLRDDAADEFVENVRLWTLIEASESARYLGRFRQAHLERFFERWLAELDDGDPRGYLRALAHARAHERDDEDARPRQEIESALQVMTIHKSKGLDFDTVYLAALHAESRRREVPLADLARDACAFFGRGSPGYSQVTARRERTDSAERVRTLYVAMTRAKNRLVLLGRVGPRTDARPPLECKSHMDLLAHSAGEDAGAALALAARQARTELDHCGVRWRLPERNARRVERARPLPNATIDMARVRADAQRLARDARVAATRAALPWSRPASAADPSAEVEPISAPRPRATHAASAAAATGRALHRALELFDFEAPRDEEIARRRCAVAAEVAGESALDAQASDRAVLFFDRIVGGALFARLAQLGPRLVARELPFLLPPDEHCLGFISGVIDLVYLDGERFVIADYKTDVVQSDAEIAARAREYAPQARAYPAALAAALSLEELPRFELWFLNADRVVAVRGDP
ncbi:MAG: UvrD-helicase domain-containing protein [Planctomycetota bacterium]